MATKDMSVCSLLFMTEVKTSKHGGCRDWHWDPCCGLGTGYRDWARLGIGHGQVGIYCLERVGIHRGKMTEWKP